MSATDAEKAGNIVLIKKYFKILLKKIKKRISL